MQNVFQLAAESEATQLEFDRRKCIALAELEDSQYAECKRLWDTHVPPEGTLAYWFFMRGFLTVAPELPYSEAED